MHLVLHQIFTLWSLKLRDFYFFPFISSNFKEGRMLDLEVNGKNVLKNFMYSYSL